MHLKSNIGKISTPLFILIFSQIAICTSTQWVSLDPFIRDSSTFVWVVISNEDSTVIEAHMPGYYYISKEFEGRILKSPFIRSWQRKPLEFGKISRESFPDLPSITTFVVIPPQKKATSYFLASGVSIMDDFLAEPMHSSGLNRFSFNEAIYSSNISFPETPFSVDEPIVFQGVRGVCIHFYPIRYLAADTAIVACNRVRGIIKYYGNEHTPGFEEPYYRIQRKMDKLNKEFFINWDKAPYIRQTQGKKEETKDYRE